VPRDRDGSFEPVIVRKRQRRLNGVDEVVLSLYAKGLKTGPSHLGIVGLFDSVRSVAAGRE
jgi:transposase-like protein